MAEITATPATQVRSDTFGGSPAANEMAKDAIVTTTGVAKASTTGDAGQKNPFVDPVAEQVNAGEEAVFAVDATLAVGKGGSASLTLATDCLIVLDEEFDDRSSGKCCGLLNGTSHTRSIPFHNVLWAEVMDDHVTIDYALPTSKTAVKPETITYLLEPTLSAPAAATNWVNKLMDRSYGESQKKKRALVLVNPHAGKGTAEKLWSKHIEPIFRAARVSIDRRTTSKGGEAVDICENMDIDAFDMVVSCSGDGLPYECFNGLGMRPDARRALGKIAVVQMPCGSGNAMAANLTGSASPSLAALGTVKGIVAPLDLMSITQGNTRTLSFLSQSVGIVAESDLATEHIRWMGQARFTYGFLIRLINKKCYPCDVAVKVAIPEKDDINTHWNAEVSGSHSSSTKLPQSSHSDLASAAASAATSSATADDGLGLPPLKYGTINDKLPSDWAVESHDEMGNFYVGNMAFMASDSNFFPAALPNDGYMDMVCIKGTIPRTAAIGLMDKVAGGKFFQDHLVSYRKVSAYRITPREQEEGWISVDGERVPFEPFQVEIHKGLGTVLAKRLHRYEAFGPQGSGTE